MAILVSQQPLWELTGPLDPIIQDGLACETSIQQWPGTRVLCPALSMHNRALDRDLSGSLR